MPKKHVKKRSRQDVYKHYAFIAGIILLIIACFGLVFLPIHFRSRKPQQPYSARNQTAATILQNKHVAYLVGDYWRITAISADMNNEKPKLAALDSCTKYHEVINSTLNLKGGESFAYLLNLDKNSLASTTCTQSEVIAAFGQPTSVSVVAGTTESPKELLLFYGGKPAHPKPQLLNSVSKSLAELKASIPQNCQNNTVMISAAHEDDDLLFMNPDLYNKLTGGSCVRTIYVTAGDNGSGKLYWMSRREGSEAAYNAMLGVDGQPWVEKTVSLTADKSITTANPVGNANVTLIFINLPDGSVGGRGFLESGMESLTKLWAGNIRSIHSIDGRANVNATQLGNMLTTFMQLFSPTEIWTQSYANSNGGDHSDHQAVGRFTTKAYKSYVNALKPSPSTFIRYYIGYPIRSLPENLSPEQVLMKSTVFETYAAHDSTICAVNKECDHVGSYDAYLFRQYYNQK